MAEANGHGRKDWVSDPRGFALAWGVPIAALIGAIFLDPVPKTVTWVVALVWMGAACIANATRCGRTHCYVTGPFFLIMAVAALLHGFEIVGLGPGGWRWLGLATGVGGGLLWCLPEMTWGKFIGQRATGP